MKKFIIFAMLVLNLSHAYGNSRNDARLRYLNDREFQSLYRNPDWKVLPGLALHRQSKIPGQGDLEPLRSWSCGPNSAARAIRMAGGDICEGCGSIGSEEYENQYAAFAHGFPKGLGRPSTLSGVALQCGSMILGVSTGSYAMTLAAAIPQLLSLSNWWFGVGHAGAPPGWLTDHVAKLASTTKVGAQHILENDFDAMAASFKDGIRHGQPSMALVVFGPLEWHYVTLIGYNPWSKEVLFVDTDGSVGLVSYEGLATRMNVGTLPSDTYATWLVSNAVSLVSNLGTYNLIRFQAL